MSKDERRCRSGGCKPKIVSHRGGSRGGGVQGARIPLCDEAFFFVFAFQIFLLHRSVTSFLRDAPPPKKNPRSAHVPAKQIYLFKPREITYELAMSPFVSNLADLDEIFARKWSCKDFFIKNTKLWLCVHHPLIYDVVHTWKHWTVFFDNYAFFVLS